MAKIKDLPHRNWDVMCDLWVPHVPALDFEASIPAPTFWYLPALSELSTTAKDRDQLAMLSGARESAFRDAIVLLRKFGYCRSAAVLLASQGFPSWSSIMGYDACYFAGRAFLALAGFVNLSRHGKIYLDLFGEREQKIQGGKRTLYDMNVIYLLSDFLSHKMTWDLVVRFRDTFKFVTRKTDAAIVAFQQTDFERVSNVRNNIVYDAGFWLSADDIEFCDLAKRVGSLEHLRDMLNAQFSAASGFAYVGMTHMFGNLLEAMLTDIARLVPGLTTEVSAMQNWNEIAYV